LQPIVIHAAVYHAGTYAKQIFFVYMYVNFVYDRITPHSVWENAKEQIVQTPEDISKAGCWMSAIKYRKSLKTGGSGRWRIIAPQSGFRGM